MTHDDADLRATAERRAKERIGMQTHLLTYVVINAGLFALDWFTDNRIDWAFWPAAGWGIGLAVHLLTTWLSLSDAHERAVEREMEHLRRRRNR